MEENLKKIELRLAALEKQNSFYRKLLTVIVIVAIGAGAAAWKAKDEEDTKMEKLILKELILTDEDGEKKACFCGDTLKFFDGKGKVTSIMDGKSLETEHVFIRDEYGVLRGKLFGSRLELLDREGKLMTLLNDETMEMYEDGKMVLNPSVLSFHKHSEKGDIPCVTFYPKVPEMTFYDPEGSGKFVINLNAFGIYYFNPEKQTRINLNPSGIDYYDSGSKKNHKWP